MRLGLITDEVSQELDEAIAFAQEFGLRDLELRVVWGRNVVDLSDDQVNEIRQRLKQAGMRVVSVAGPVLKCDWPGIPFVAADARPNDAASKPSRSSESSKSGSGTTARRTPPGDLHAGPAQATAQEHVERLFGRELKLAEAWSAPYVRIFSFWRTPEVTILTDNDALTQLTSWIAPLLDQARAAGKQVLLENEHACVVGDGEESRQLLEQPALAELGLIWDPGNAFWLDERPYPSGYEQLRRVERGRRVRHVHIKDARRTGRPDRPYEWVAVGEGEIDYPGQLAALARDGFDGVLSLETHWEEVGLSGWERTRRCLLGLEQALRQAGLRRDSDGVWEW